jgi:hypothetical protein
MQGTLTPCAPDVLAVPREQRAYRPTGTVCIHTETVSTPAGPALSLVFRTVELGVRGSTPAAKDGGARPGRCSLCCAARRGALRKVTASG